jgi:Skp family chaperone for outer membrane proteins
MSKMRTNVVKTTPEILALHAEKKPLDAERNRVNNELSAILERYEQEVKPLYAKMDALQDQIRDIDARLARAAREVAA